MRAIDTTLMQEIEGNGGCADAPTLGYLTSAPRNVTEARIAHLLSVGRIVQGSFGYTKPGDEHRIPRMRAEWPEVPAEPWDETAAWINERRSYRDTLGIAWKRWQPMRDEWIAAGKLHPEHRPHPRNGSMATYYNPVELLAMAQAIVNAKPVKTKCETEGCRKIGRLLGKCRACYDRSYRLKRKETNK